MSLKTQILMKIRRISDKELDDISILIAEEMDRRELREVDKGEKYNG